jgi:hypothetical protein
MGIRDDRTRATAEANASLTRCSFSVRFCNSRTDATIKRLLRIRWFSPYSKTSADRSAATAFSTAFRMASLIVASARPTRTNRRNGKRYCGGSQVSERKSTARHNAVLVGASIYLFTDRGSRLTGIALAGRLDNLGSASVTASGLRGGIGTSATASFSRTSHWHIL